MLRHALMTAAAVGLAAADVTIYVNAVEPVPFNFSTAATSASQLLQAAAPEEFASSNPYAPPELLMSSWTNFTGWGGVSPGSPGSNTFPSGTLFPSSDGLIRGALDAWAKHQQLILRPDEVWFEILAQLNFYMTEHAEDVRDLFVDFSGKQEIVVREWTWYDVVRRFASEIQARVKTDWLEEWIMPGFTTSTPNDDMTATVLMMGLMQHYFEFMGGILCGLPRVTLAGTRGDWVALEAKLDRLADFGAEPAEYARRLRPVLHRFVLTWDYPGSDDIKTFWSQIVRAEHHFTCGRGAVEYDVSGWITAFYFWKTDGTLREPQTSYPSTATPSVTLDGVGYSSVPLDKLPVGYAKAPLVMLDYPSEGLNITAYVLAGNVAVARTPPTNNGTTGEGRWVTAQPTSAWFMYGAVNASFTTGGYGGLGNRAELNTIAGNFDTCAASPRKRCADAK